MGGDNAPLTVAEAVGPPLPLGEAAAAISMGVFALLMAGVMPILLGGLVDAHRLTSPQLGLAATLEGLTMGLGTGAAAALLEPRHLRPIGCVAALVLAGLDLTAVWGAGLGIVGLRALAGVPEGLLLWIAIGMIARNATPERLSAFLLAAMTLAQFFLAVLLTAYVLPAFGSGGGFVTLALATLPCAGIVWFAPRSYAALVRPLGEGRAPPLRGWAALAATVVFTASFPAAGVFLQPLAHQAGLSAETARIALTLSLLAQVIGAGIAAVVADRLHYMVVFGAGSAIYLACWAVMGGPAPGWAFIGVNALAGFTYLMMTPYLVPMVIAADPSRRAAVMGGGAQVVAGALGPLTASFIVSDADVHSALWLAVAYMLTGLAMMAGMYALERRDAAHRQVAVVGAG